MANAGTWTQINGFVVAEVSKDCWLQVRASDYCGCILLDCTGYSVGDTASYDVNRLIVSDSAIKYASGSAHIVPMKKGDKFCISCQNASETVTDICYYREIPFRF